MAKNIALALGWILAFAILLCTGKSGSKYQPGELTKIADKQAADKGSLGHLYTEVYENFFFPLKYKARKILEIGVAGGASLRMFQAYFPNAVIYGIDILDSSHLDSRTIKTFVADQAEKKQLLDFIGTHGGNFDLILDDGGHTMRQQQVSFGFLFKYLKPGGIYIIEDVHTSLASAGLYEVESNRQNTTLSMIDYFIRTGMIESQYLAKEERKYLVENIGYCNLLSKNRGRSIACIFKKRRPVDG
jgi:predicted O-methyltransferase YrrM